MYCDNNVFFNPIVIIMGEGHEGNKNCARLHNGVRLLLGSKSLEQLANREHKLV